MAGNAVASIQGPGGAVTGASAGPPVTAEERSLNRSVSAAVQALNESRYLGSGRAVTFSIDHASRLPVVMVVDTSTNQVVEQWPSAYLLRLAAEIKKLTRDSG
jgi:uncharacterized FlaG/YvyC family protein